MGFVGLYALCLPLEDETNVFAFFARILEDDPALGLPWILGFLIGSNICLFGFFLVLAGLKELPLKGSSRARTGFRMKMLGANVMAVMFWLIVVDDYSGQKHVAYLALPPVAWLGVALIRRGFRFDAISAAEVLSEDRRPPVVYLRSFRQDDDRLLPGVMRIFAFYVAMNFEQILTAILSPIGPVVAIGRPAEEVPELGAARMYFPNDEWREQIGAFMARARLVVIRMGTTDNVWWEIEEAIRTVDPTRLIVVAVESGKQRAQLLSRLGELLGRPLQEPQGRVPEWLMRALNLGFKGYEPPVFLAFSSRWEPRYERCGIRWGASALEHPAWPSIEYALRRILRTMGLNEHRRKSRGTAFALGLLLGWAGGHCFYLGQRRRGWTYLLLCWTMVPAFLSVRDTWRITLATREEFELRYPGFGAFPATARSV